MSLTPELFALKEEMKEHALAYGLDFFETFFELLDFDQLNEIASFGGFPTRYPHWRFGMSYDEMMKGYSYGLSKIYELVINNDPCYAYLMRSNSQLDQKLVMAHVYGHSDFFKNNMWFAGTNRKMMDQMANHGTRVRKMIDRYGLEKVETFLDACLSLENLIDVHSVAIRRSHPVTEEEIEQDEIEAPARVAKLKSKEYMDRFINPPEYLEAQKERLKREVEKKKRFPAEPARDVLLFLLEHAPLASWERAILTMIREEAYYFAPQAMTKIMNEGWACVTGETLVPTARGFLPIRRVVEGRLEVEVSDGSSPRRITDHARFEERATVRIRTRRGFEVEGSTTHRLLTATGEFRSLGEVEAGDRVRLALGAGIWATKPYEIDFQPAERLTLDGVAALAGVHVRTVIRHRDGEVMSRSAGVLDPLLDRYGRELEEFGAIQTRRADLRIPRWMDSSLAEFLGYLLSDGNVSRVKRVVGFTTGDRELADRYANRVRSLFGIDPDVFLDGNRYRVLTYSLDLIDFLESLGVPSGPAASRKQVPEAVLRSPREAVCRFLSAYFDGDGHAGPTGVILVSASEKMTSVVQQLLLNLGILSRRRRQKDGCWRLAVRGRSAKRFESAVGFGLGRKRRALRDYVEGHQWFKKEAEEDEIVSVETGRADVYDVTVEETHRYAAGGFVNHNSFWHSKIMTEKALTDAEVVDYADRHAGTLGTRPGQINPYKLGIELFRDIEDRWNRGKFGKEWEEEPDYDRKRTWDTGAGIGRDKIFEVRRIYNDVTFIDTFLTEEFAEAQKLFVYRVNPHTGRYEIADRDWRKVKNELLFALTNRGQPIIEVADGNYLNRGELVLAHRWEGVDLRLDYAQETLKNVHRIWRRPVHIETRAEGKGARLSFDGEKVTSEEIPAGGE